MNEARPAVKRARLDPKVIAAWNEVCARDAVLRRRLRTMVFLPIPLLFGLLIASGMRFLPENPAYLLVFGVTILVSFTAKFWNNGLVGQPPCPGCGEPIVQPGGRGLAHPESLEWCPHCLVWLKHPSDPHRPLT